MKIDKDDAITALIMGAVFALIAFVVWFRFFR